MAKTVVSIEIGESKTRAAVLIMGKNRQNLKQAVVFDTPRSAMEDGYIRDYGMFAEQLLLKLRGARIKPKDLVFTIASNKVISREVIITAAKEKLIKSIIRAEVDEYFPMDLSEHIIAYSIIGHEPGSDQYRLMIYAAPETLIYGYYSVAREMRCRVEAIDFAGNSVYQWFKTSSLDETTLIMEMNEKSSVITIIDKGEMGVQRTINYGATTLAEALAESGSYDGVNTTEAAMELLLNHGFLSAGENGDELWREKELAKIREARFQRIETGQAETETGEVEDAERSVERLLSDEEILKRRVVAHEDVTEAARVVISNLRRVMDYHTSKNNGATVQKIYITGLGASIEGLDAMVAEETDTPAEIYDVSEGVSFARSVEEYADRGQEFLSCFGAVIKPLGFRPAEYEEKEKKKEVAIVSAVIFFAAAAAIGFLILTTWLDIQKQEDRKVQLQAEVTEASKIEDLVNVYTASQSSVQMMSDTDALTFSEAEQLNGIITALERALPKRSTVHNISINGADMTINFTTITKEEAAKVFMQLKQIPYIQDVTVGGLVEKVEEGTNRTQVSFTVNCILQKYDETEDVAAEGEEE